jgi:hypothetical protein
MTQTLKSTWSKLDVPIVVILALTLAACASMGGGRDEAKIEEALKASVEAFNGDIKWEDYQGASSFQPADKKGEFWAEMDRFKGKIRIVEYQLREVEFKAKSCSATAILSFQYWRTDAPTIRTVTLNQKWYFIEKERQWKVLDSGFGAITKPRPSL